MARNIWDMHCHIVPGVDDGAKTIETSLTMIRKGYGEGIRHIICTPHYRKGMFETDRDEVEQNFMKLKRTAETRFEGLRLYLGCEFHVNMEMEEVVGTDPRYRMNGTSYVLSEFSESASSRRITERCYALVNQGYIPIIAHGERIDALRGNPSLIDDVHQMGGYLQINADSIIGIDGWSVKRFCAKMIRTGRVDFVGSDAHNMKDRPSRLAESFDYVAKKFGDGTAVRLYFDNPLHLMRGEII